MHDFPGPSQDPAPGPSHDASQDPLKALFEQAAAAGRSRATYAPAGEISARGRRVHRHRVAVLAAGACLVVGAGGVGLGAALSGPSRPVAPATSPSVTGPAPADTATGPSTPLSSPTQAPSAGATSSPPAGEPRSTSTIGSDSSTTAPPSGRFRSTTPPGGSATTAPPGGAG
ncbi:hypothetical protein ACWGI1_18730 [Streptomyces sp. NPDC054835]